MNNLQREYYRVQSTCTIMARFMLWVAMALEANRLWGDYPSEEAARYAMLGAYIADGHFRLEWPK